MARDSTPRSIAARTIAKDIVNACLDDTITVSFTIIKDQSMGQNREKGQSEIKTTASFELNALKNPYANYSLSLSATKIFYIKS